MIPLFRNFPSLQKKLPYLQLGDTPTPVDILTGLEKKLSRSGLYIKRDDLSGTLYGGNKVRKLEFLLADALSKGATRVVTAGAAGSNHALATSLYARKAGLKSTLVLFPQPNSETVRNNLLMDIDAGAEIHYFDSYEEYRKNISTVADHYKKTDGKEPYVIPLGGSSLVGAAGFVNAGLELREQIANGTIPEPLRIYVALGTMGTAAGLLAGLRVAGVKSQLCGIRVTPENVASPNAFTTLYKDLIKFLNSLDHTFPKIPFDPDSFVFSDNYIGEGYGVPTSKSIRAIKLLEETANIHLDETYTGKTFAAFIDEAETDSHEPLLFWNTKNSRPFDRNALSADISVLPVQLRELFNETPR